MCVLLVHTNWHRRDDCWGLKQQQEEDVVDQGWNACAEALEEQTCVHETVVEFFMEYWLKRNTAHAKNMEDNGAKSPEASNWHVACGWHVRVDGSFSAANWFEVCFTVSSGEGHLHIHCLRPVLLSLWGPQFRPERHVCRLSGGISVKRDIVVENFGNWGPSESRDIYLVLSSPEVLDASAGRPVVQ